MPRQPGTAWWSRVTKLLEAERGLDVHCAPTHGAVFYMKL